MRAPTKTSDQTWYSSSSKQIQSIRSTPYFHKLPPSYLLPNGQEESIPHIPQARLEHAAIRQLGIHAGQPDLDGLGPLGRNGLDARRGTEHREHDDAARTPLAQRLDRGRAGPARSDDRVNDDGQAGRFGAARARAAGVIRQVVVVLDRVQGRGLAVEAEVVDGDRAGEEGLNGYGGC